MRQCADLPMCQCANVLCAMTDSREKSAVAGRRITGVALLDATLGLPETLRR
jgi:hypothetical protein